MHDIDRTLMELEPEADYEFEGESDYETEEYESSDTEATFEEYESSDAEAVFDETEEMELAAELLSVSDEAELDQFLGRLLINAFKKIGRKKTRSGKPKYPILKKIGGFARGLIKKTLPIAGRVVGSIYGGPAGGAIGGAVGSAAPKLLGLELEGLSPEDQEFEVARRVVRLTGEAVKNTALTPPEVDPSTAAKMAFAKAAKKHAPGLLRPIVRPPFMVSGRSGRWIRRGRKIVLMGV